MTELRDSRGKLRAIWNPEEKTITIRDRGVDMTFTLKSNGDYDLVVLDENGKPELWTENWGLPDVMGF